RKARHQKRLKMNPTARFHGTMPRHMRRGPASVCRPEQNGSLPREVDWCRRNIRGALICAQRESLPRNGRKEVFRMETPPKMVLSAAQALRVLRRRLMDFMT